MAEYETGAFLPAERLISGQQRGLWHLNRDERLSEMAIKSNTAYVALQCREVIGDGHLPNACSRHYGDLSTL